jgi:hypothetical protein
MTVRLENVQAVVRVYDDDGTADARGPYIGIANILWVNFNRVFIMGMHGTWSRKNLKALFEELRKRGVTHVDAERRGKHVTYSLEDL